MMRFGFMAFAPVLALTVTNCSGPESVPLVDREQIRVLPDRGDAWHTMRKGDTFSSLSRLYGVPAGAIATANPQLNPTSIPVGTRVLIPGGAQPVVSPVEPPVAAPKPVRTPDRGRLCYPVLGTATKSKKPAPGTEFTTEMQATVVAADSGTVVLATQNLSGLGPTVMIDHGGNLCTMYAWLSDYSVQPGQKITRGESLGRTGARGLLFRVYRGPLALDPEKFLK